MVPDPMPTAVVLYRLVVEIHHIIDENPVRFATAPQGFLPFPTLSVGQHLEQFAVLFQYAVNRLAALFLGGWGITQGNTVVHSVQEFFLGCSAVPADEFVAHMGLGFGFPKYNGSPSDRIRFIIPGRARGKP